MDKTERLGLVVSRSEKEALERLAELEGGLSQAALLRRLIRKAAEQQGIWVPTAPLSAANPTPGGSGQ